MENSILQAFLNDYFLIYEVDLDHDEMRGLYKAHDKTERYSRFLYDQSSRFKEAGTISAIRLGLRYRDVYDVGQNAEFRVLERDEKGLHKVLLCFKKQEDPKVVTRMSEDLQMSIQKQRSYMDALIADADAYNEINLTKNRVIYKKNDLIKDDPWLRSQFTNSIFNYDEITLRWADALVIDEDRERYLSIKDRESLIKEFKRGKTTATFEYSILLLQKEYYLRETYVLRELSDTHDIVGLNVVRDITVEKNAERNYMAVLEVLSHNYDTISIVDLENNTYEVLRTNNAIEYMHSKDHSHISDFNVFLNNYIDRYVYEEDRKILKSYYDKDHIQELFSGRDTFTSEYRIMIGHEIEYRRLTVADFEKEEEIKRIVIGIENITHEIKERHDQRVLLEAALKQAEYANRSKSMFLSDMSHDIRTPLNVIVGYAKIGMDHMDDKKQVERSYKKILDSTKHLSSLINNILDISRIESGRLHMDEQPYRLDALVEELNGMIRVLLDKKKQIYRCKVKVMNQDILVDHLRFRQVFLNLLTNAIKYTKENGTITFTIKQLPKSPTGYGSYECIVADNGSGMDEEILGKIYEPFERGQSTTDSGIQGYGLGLSIVKNLVELMGGTIHVETKKDKGTTFKVILDFKLQKGETPELIDYDERFDKAYIKNKKVLVVEDNAMNREIMTTLLEDLGMEVHCEEDGLKAYEYINEHRREDVDIILMDIWMPNMDGYASTRKIRSINDERSLVPIVGVSANAFTEDKQKALRAGMNGYITKPIDMKELIHVISQLTRKH